MKETSRFKKNSMCKTIQIKFKKKLDKIELFSFASRVWSTTFQLQTFSSFKSLLKRPFFIASH
jgi:hypothetical protein